MLNRIQRLLSKHDNYVFHASLKLLKRKPRLVPRLINLYLSYYFRKNVPLRLLDIAITKACPYHCPHCYPDGFYNMARTPLSEKEIAKAIRQAVGMGVVQFNFQGGEPTLDLDRLERIVSTCDPFSRYVSLSSNGFTNTRPQLKRIHDMGVDKIALSLHSGIPEEHDAFVGFDGAFARVMDCLRLGREIGLETTLAVVVTRETLKSPGVQKVFDLAVRMKTILDVNVAIPAGKWAKETDRLLSKDDYHFLKVLNKKHGNIRRDLFPHLFKQGCLAAKELIYINVYGDILSCPFLHFSPGNITSGNLASLRRTMLTHPDFQIHAEKCLACEDDAFFKAHITKTFESEELPLPWTALSEAFPNKNGKRNRFPKT